MTSLRRPLRPAFGRRVLAALLAIACSVPALARGQAGPAHAHAGHAVADVPVSAAARAQIATARAAVQALATPAAARAAGYRPMFGNVPLQGEHYVRVDLVLGGRFDLAAPSVLMFAPVKGTPTLVGAAYAYLRDSSAAPPAGFDGAAGAWHAHAGLGGIPGRHLVMMHTWFVDAPEGPFARYNPWLPYYAAGLTPPVPADSAADVRARRLGFALSLVAAPPLLFQLITQRADSAGRTGIERRQAMLSELVPALAASERSGDRAAHDRLAAEATRQADTLVQAYRRAAGDTTLAARLVDRTVDEFMGRGHGVEEELGALFSRQRRRGR